MTRRLQHPFHSKQKQIGVEWALAQVLPSSRRSLEGGHSNCCTNSSSARSMHPTLGTHVCSHARHLRTHSAPFSAPHRRWCVLQMLITSSRGDLPGLPGNWDASPGIPVKTCDKKERNKNKCTSDAADELHQQHGPKDHAGHVCAERNGSSSCC